MILAIDPGPKKSAFAILDKGLRPAQFGIYDNEDLLDMLPFPYGLNHFAIEMVASYGMPVGKETFETVFWIGRFWEKSQHYCPHKQFVYRKQVTLNLCGSARAKDGNVRQALIDRFAHHDFKNGKGKKKDPDVFYGFHDDVWSAYAVGVTYHDLYLDKQQSTGKGGEIENG